MASIEIHGAKTVSGNSPAVLRAIEKSGQTFVSGTPVQLDSAVDGGVKEWGATAGTDLIFGFVVEPANNLASTGLGAPGALAPVTGVGSGLTFGSVPYQTSGKNIPRGQPFTDGRLGVELAGPDTVFIGQVGPAQTTVLTDVGKTYGLTKDSDGHWYVDRTKTGANAVVEIQQLHRLDGALLAGRVLFVVTNANRQVLA